MLNLIKLMAVMALVTFSASVFAIPTTTFAFAIPTTTLRGDGVIWTLSVTTTDNLGSFTLSADVSGADSLLEDAYLHEFSLKNFGSDAMISNIITTSTGTWDGLNEGLAANGCKGKGTYDALCVYNTGGFMDAPSTGSDFQTSEPFFAFIHQTRFVFPSTALYPPR